MATLKDRIAQVDKTVEADKSPIAELFRYAQLGGPQMVAEAAKEQQKDELRDLSVDVLDEMEQPFRLYTDEQMDDMVESIRRCGIIQRIVVRPSQDTPGHYQIISGRNRRRAAMRAGYVTVPCEIRQLDDDEAQLLMVETNLRQRDELLPSERAKAYKIRLDALSHQGKRTSPQSEAKLRTSEVIAQEAGSSRAQVERYIRLTYLIPPLLSAIDEKRLGFGVGVTLSYISPKNQEAIYSYFFEEQKKLTITPNMAAILREQDSQHIAFTPDVLQNLAEPHTPTRQLRKISVPMKPLRKYFPASATEQEIQTSIIELVKANAEGEIRLKWNPGEQFPKHPMTAVAKFRSAEGGDATQRLVMWDGSAWRFPGDGGASIDAECVGWWPVPGEEK